MSTTDVAALSQTIFSQFIIFLIVFDMLEFVAAEFECWNNLLWYFNAFHIVIRESMSRSDHFGVCCWGLALCTVLIPMFWIKYSTIFDTSWLLSTNNFGRGLKLVFSAANKSGLFDAMKRCFDVLNPATASFINLSVLEESICLCSCHSVTTLLPYRAYKTFSWNPCSIKLQILVNFEFYV